MKVRTSFVSNSSSCSFIVSRSDITEEQLDKIINYYDVAIEMISVMEPIEGSQDMYPDIGFIDSYWTIYTTKTRVVGDTNMDNFDMLGFLKLIGVDKTKIKEGDGYYFGQGDIVDLPETEDDFLEAIGMDSCRVMYENGETEPIEDWVKENNKKWYNTYGVMVNEKIIEKEQKQKRREEEWDRMFKKK